MRPAFGGLLCYLRQVAPGPEEDGVLLARFGQGDGDAFAALVVRYAPLVWGVCRRLLGRSPDAEDAFQATFVVLVMKGAALDDRPLGPWLHKVARETALKARLQAARRQAREAPAEAEPAVFDPPDLERRELAAALEEELGRLPERYRVPVILCYLEGLTNEEAARRLACPKGTVISRLARARKRLRARLLRRGFDMPATLLPVLAAREAAPRMVVESVVSAAPLLRAGGKAALSASVMNLAKGAMFSMIARKLELIGLALLSMVLLALGVGLLAGQSEARPTDTPTKVEAKKPERPKDKAAREAGLDRAMKVGEILNTRIERYGGLDDPRTTLAEALDQLHKVFSRLPGGREYVFHINEKAFKEEKIDNVLSVEVPNHNPNRPMGKVLPGDSWPLPPMENVPMATILKRILERVPVPSGATYLIRKDGIEITTQNAVRAELRLPANTPLLLVLDDFRKVPLEKALNDISEALDVTVAVDARVAEKARVEVTARLRNVPLDTAVRMLADMAGLGVVRLENALYVTAKENAALMKKEK